jgi:signal transduction histidine kinase
VTFRGRLLGLVSLATLLPLLLVAWGIRSGASARLDAAAESALEGDVEALLLQLRYEEEGIRERLAAVQEALDRDPEVRGALQGPGEERLPLLDALPRLAALTGLELLRLQDRDGTILASGHFRNEFDRVEPLPAPGVLHILRVPAVDGVLQVRVLALPVRLGGRDLVLVGGVSRGLPQGVRTVPLPAGAVGRASPGDLVTRQVMLPLLDTSVEPVVRGEMPLEVSRSAGEVRALQRQADLWILLGAALLVASTLALARWLGRGLVAPLEGLAETARRVDLERPDVSFPQRDRTDEVGALARVLERMTARLRGDAARLREAERRATVADVARQVHHDIRNGLVPLRNVLRHLSQVKEEAPATLPEVYAGREGTLHASVDYLEGLASGWARLGGGGGPLQSLDVGAVATLVAGSAAAPQGVTVRARVAPGVPPVRGDALVLRRIMENLVRNALDALGSGPGQVTVAVEAVDGSLPPGPEVRIIVSDTGPGLPPGPPEQVFRDFFTTREGGTGLGLSIVRRLVMDLGGSVEAGAAPGGGACFTVLLPVESS